MMFEPVRGAREPLSRRQISRRAALGLALGAGLASTACSRRDRGTAQPPAPSVSALTNGKPFYIAHRGGGGDWPEMTAYAYDQASKVPGLLALEISVCRSRDGVLVCSHDPTTTRMTGVPYTIAEQSWSTLSGLTVSAKETLDPAQPGRPLARLDDLLERYIDQFVLFVEPKVQVAQDALLKRLRSLNAPERVVWKQPIIEDGFDGAKSAGFTTWGYVLDDPSHRSRYRSLAASPTIDMLGIPVGAGRPFVDSVAGAARDNGKQTIAWAISTTEQRDRALSFGAAGLMTSTIRETGPTCSLDSSCGT